MFGPLLLVAVVAGAAAGVLTSTVWLAALAIALAAASLALAAPTGNWRRGLVVTAVAAAALADGAAARDRAVSSPLDAWFDAAGLDAQPGMPTEVQGILQRDRAIGESGVALAIDVRRVRDGEGWHDARGRLRATVVGDWASQGLFDLWTAGRPISAPVLLRRPQQLRNPGAPDDAWQRLRRDTDLVGTIKSGALVSVARAGHLAEGAAAVRRHVRRSLGRAVGVRSTESAAIITAILIGDRGGLDADVLRRLQIAGTYHVIAISGGNIALLVALGVALLRLVVRSPRLVALAAMCLVVAYGALVGPEPSVERAVVAACVYLSLGVVGLAPPAINVWLVVAAGVVIADPLVTIDVGAWLSFGATLGIIIGASRAMAWVHARVSPIDEHPDGQVPLIQRRGGLAAAQRAAVHRLWRAAVRRLCVVVARRSCVVLAGLVASTCAAELAVVPVVATVFSRVGIAGLVLNLVAIPAMAVAQVAGLLAVAADGWWPGAERLAGLVALGGARALVGSSELVDILPELSWRVPPTSVGWIVGYYAALALYLWIDHLRVDADHGDVTGATALVTSRWARGVPLVIAATALGVIVTAPGVRAHGPAPGWLRVSMLDVGQGEAIVVQFPSGQSLLVDAGGVPGSFDLGGRVVTPALWALGVRRLDWLAVTHADLDHAGGARSVLHDFRPREVWEGVPVPRNDLLRALDLDAERLGLIRRQLLAGHMFDVGAVRVEVLHPPPPDWERQKVRNDDSIVLRLRCGAVEMLLTGDVSREVEATLPVDREAPVVRLLAVPHHGSRTSSSWPWLDALRPQAAFISAGRGNIFGHPAAEVLERYGRLGVTVFRTDVDGAIVIETDGREVRVRTLAGWRWRFLGP